MPINVTSIAFDHGAGEGRARPLAIRRNATQSLPVPEWRRGQCVQHADSLVAFALEDSRDARLSVEVRLRTDVPWLRQADVRAVGVVNLATPLPAQPSPVLGHTEVRTVAFDRSGESGPVLFSLQDLRIWDRGVGVHDFAWSWQARVGVGWPWVPVDVSRHRAYVVLREPRPPWSTEPRTLANAELPWTDLLEYACRWARGARTAEQVSEWITRAVFELGVGVVRYDCPGGGGSHYTFPAPTFRFFDCSQFIRLLRGDPYASRWVNCMDCAAMVSTAANALGCDLWQAGMFSDDGPFDLNPILAIGAGTWETACGWGSFGYHEVAWAGDAEADDTVYDACLLVDGGADPGRAPFLPTLAANLRFGRPGAYRDRLAAATPAGRPRCRPQPQRTRRRRVVI